MSERRKLTAGEPVHVVDGGSIIRMVVVRHHFEYAELGWDDRPTIVTLRQDREEIYPADETERLIKDLNEVRSDAQRNIEQLTKTLEPSAA